MLNSCIPDQRAELSTSRNVEAQDFAGIAFGGDFEGAAADFAICREALRGDAGIDGQLKGLAAERALDGFGDFHRPIIAQEGAGSDGENLRFTRGIKNDASPSRNVYGHGKAYKSSVAPQRWDETPHRRTWLSALQRPDMGQMLDNSCVAARWDVLRLVLRTQPRSMGFAADGFQEFRGSSLMPKRCGLKIRDTAESNSRYLDSTFGLNLSGGKDFLRWRVVGDEVAVKLGERASSQRCADIGHQLDVHVRVMDADEAQAENFVGLEQMPHVGAREEFAGEAFAAFFDGPEVRLVRAAFDAIRAASRDGGAVAGDARGQHAIEHIHAARDKFHHLRRRAQAHGVTRLFLRQERHGQFHGLHHFRLGFAHADAADGVAVKIIAHDGFGAFLAQRGIDAALADAEDQLAFTTRLFAAFLRPTDGALHGQALFPGGRIVRRTFIETHRDIRTERALNLHRFFRPEKQFGTIEVRTEFHTVRLHFADLGEAEDLEPAAVGEDGLLPIHEGVQAAGELDDVHAGADVEMIGVAEDDLRIHLQQFTGVERLHAGLRAHGHENGRIDDAMGGGEPAQTRFGVGICY